MVLQFVLFLLGLVILYLGAEWLVKSASSLALRFGIRPIVIGLTVVALGTSMPEFLLNFFAVHAGENDLAVGNILGSNIANIALILGVSATLMPLAINRDMLRKEYPVMLLVTLSFYGLALDGVISRVDGGILVAGLVAFMIFLVLDARRHARKNRSAASNSSDTEKASKNGETVPPQDAATRVAERTPEKPGERILLLLGGIVALAAGARLMVVSAVEIAQILHVPPVIIGLTIVAIGTSLPEMAASIMCVVKDEGDMSIGNIMGSNILNILFVVGLVSLIRPMQVSPASLSIHFPVMIGFTLLFYPIAVIRKKISKIEGFLLLTGYSIYMIWLILPYLS